MLKELRIENLAIIKTLDLEIKDGLIALTGETGAGKSIILDGINLLIGETVSDELIRTGEDKLVAEGVFEISDYTKQEILNQDIDLEGNELIIRREIPKSGRSRIYLNGSRFPMYKLKEIMNHVVDLVGQHSHQTLLKKENHIKLIDSYLGEKGQKYREKVGQIKTQFSKVEKEIEDLYESKKSATEKKEFFRYQIKELEKLDLKIGEDDELEKEYKKLFNAGKIREKLGDSNAFLQENEYSVLELLSEVKEKIESISSYNENYEKIIEKLEGGYYQIEEVAFEIEEELMEVEVDDGRLTEVVKRLDEIKKAKKKYGVTIEEILDYYEKIKSKLNRLESMEFEEKKLQKRKEKFKQEYEKEAEKLSQKRKEIASDIEKKLVEALEDLKMKGINFKTEFLVRDDLHHLGRDLLEFKIATNIGEELKPLAKIASGGEVSRIMLALKAIFSKVDKIPILIFDEIDTGVGGETVKKVADKLKNISEGVQVLCITHSPQIASKATQHFYIEKTTISGKTETKVKELEHNQKIIEISRMLGGENISNTVKEHARELLREGNNGL
ncbi:MAG: DNA repair protein RecN [Fusobacteriota bacterium]